jgi:hypothetical protein
MHYPSKFGKICYGPNVFLGSHIRGNACVLCSLEHDPYPSNSLVPWCLIIECVNDGIGFLV